ncbi:MAG: XRE family transcriptional regulator, partial [Mesorhizobium sp.]
MEVQSLVAWNLRRLRVERGISQDDLALSAGDERA